MSTPANKPTRGDQAEQINVVHDRLDFSLASYLTILHAAQSAGYATRTVLNALDPHTPAPPASQPQLILRHDVDRRPANALAMAQAEHRMGINATYYFRVVGPAYDPAIICDIAEMGHEIGYHYEDFYSARYDADAAYAAFQKHLMNLRGMADIRTIAMHGSPLSRFNNMDLWDSKSFANCGVLDCTLSRDWSDTVFLTDTGRRFDAIAANLRDDIGALSAPGISSPDDVARYLSQTRPSKVLLSTHPERWSRNLPDWVRQLATDHLINMAKTLLRTVRRTTS